MSKRDRQGVRTPADLERKYGIGQAFTNQDQTNARQARQIEELSQAVSGNVNGFNYSIQQLNSRLAAVEEKLNGTPAGDASDDIAELTTRITTAETTLASLEARVAALEKGEVVT